MSETEISKAIQTAVNASRMACVFRIQSGMVRVRGAMMHLSPVGTPDLLGYLHDGTGRMIALEVKTSTGKLRMAQTEWIAKARAAGVLCIVARSVKEAIDAILDDRKTRLAK